MKKKLFMSFTLLEVLFVIIIVSMWLMSVLYAINYASDNVKSVKQRVIAINLAREGMEWVFQIRDTNWLSSPSKKDECRLDMNPLLDQWSTDWCSDDKWMGSWNYILQKIISGDQQTFYLSWWSNWAKLNLSDGVDSNDTNFALCWSGALGLRQACPGYNWPVAYFRQIHWEWLFLKDSNTTGWDYLDCANWTSPSACWWIDAKEYRFCSKVAYIWQWAWEVELCGLITNFWK